MSDIFDDLKALGFCGSRGQLEALLTHATKSRLSPVQLLENLVSIERRERDARNLASRTKKAAVGSCKTMDQYDWDYPTKLDRAACEEQVFSLAFTKGTPPSNVLFRGASGLGKTMMAKHTANLALAAGMTVYFTNTSAALADLLRQESLPALERRMKRYINVDLLVFDELGYVPCDKSAADILFQIISRRHESVPTIVATNLAFKEWGPMFHGAASLVPLIDRFTERLVTIDIEAEESYRQKNKDKAQATPPSAPKPTPRPKGRSGRRSR
jgi:DNA replication protein DnaC